jgi:thymidylate synthase (FAD)
MKVELINSTSLKGIIAGYRECHSSQDKSDNGGEKDIALIKRLLFDFHPAHESPIEHAIYTWRISGVSRVLTHQLVRHRIASYSQRSQRYVSEVEFDFVTPPSFNGVLVDVGAGVGTEDATKVYNKLMKTIAGVYKELREAGIPKEDARFVLPNACETSIIVSMNPRAFRNFLNLRLDKKAQWEIKLLAALMLESIPDDHKFMYEDLVKAE